MRGVRHLLAALGLLVVLALPGCSALQDRSFEYALPINPYSLSEPGLRRALDLAQEAGVGTIVTGATWWYLAPERSPESYRWGPLDLLVEESRRRGLRLNLQITGTPDWVHPYLEETVPDPERRVWYPPRGQGELEHFGDFTQALTERYGSRIDRYEVWNEPNYDKFWGPDPDPDEYAALLRTAYLSIKEVEPGATVVFGGLSRNDIGFLSEYYEASRKYPEAGESKHFFDVLNVHPYTDGQSPDWTHAGEVNAANGPWDPSFVGVEKMKYVMEQNESLDKPIFIGEFGYSTTKTWMEAVPDYRRALYLKRAYAIARELPSVSGMSWYSYIPDSSVGQEWAILDSNLNPSVTYRALKQVTGAEEAEIAVSLPEPQAPVSETYVVEPDLSGIDASEASGWELFVDGNLVGSYGEVPVEWDARQLDDGDHSLLLAMYTKDGSVWPSDPITFRVGNV